MFTAYESVLAPSSSQGARSRRVQVVPAVERHDADPPLAHRGEVGCRCGGGPRGRSRSVLDASAEDQLDDGLALPAVPAAAWSIA